MRGSGLGATVDIASVDIGLTTAEDDSAEAHAERSHTLSASGNDRAP